MFQELFLVLALCGIVVYALSGASLFASVVGGSVLGGLTFLPLALLFVIYLFGKQHSTPQL